ncbi:lipoprotein, putative [Citrifermentans bemidjiense Bem]|uniref:Lipoprotein, putative n=1 Tax=Citrifermentans bemidjiense (strain ATCC BAA-1014 / DSM 16622 / JCM 12645 / Bem) TaxID=404380 RepID=B5EHK6_CITBB|nr:hypothetical protein [Citrifermentans bemidjiense]ACH38216.1 lipoprotein, putative [Citrifermentans bemidjiense Bem]
MKPCLKLFLLILVSIAFSGCAVRSGQTKKLDGYETKLKILSVVYRDGKTATDERMAKKLERYNFQHIGDYMAKIVPPTFSSYGIAASFTSAQPTAPGTPDAKALQTLYISPTKVSTTKHKDLELNTGPSARPMKVEFEAYLFDPVVKREVWTGQFSVVVGGLLYDSFGEKKTAELVNAVITGMKDDGLLEEIHP